MGAPQKVVADDERATELLKELRRAHDAIQQATDERARLALEANELGVTQAKIGEAIGVSNVAVSYWIRGARGQRASMSD